MSDTFKISVIMPVYKVEEYVAKAIESILNQTLAEFEFLIVDDGSPDNSGAICDAYAKTDKRIRVIHKENGGAASARNTAIEQAVGEYFYFLDSDDWAEPDMLEEMYYLARRDRAQLVVSGFYIETYYSDEEYLSLDVKEADAVYTNKEDFRKQAYKYFDKNLLYTPWNKLYEGDYIRERSLRFPNTLWDDFPFNLSVVRDIERVTVTERQFYHFLRSRAESETAAYRPDMYEKREEEHGWMMELYRGWGIRDKASAEMVARRYIERFVGCMENLTNPNCDLPTKEKKRLMKEMLANPRVDEALKRARPKSKLMKIMLVPIRMKSVMLTLAEAKVISLAKSKNTKIFARLKARR